MSSGPDFKAPEASLYFNNKQGRGRERGRERGCSIRTGTTTYSTDMPERKR